MFTKLFEEIFYKDIVDIIQYKIDKHCDNKQYGFKLNSSTFQAIENLYKDKNKNAISIFIDLSRAYERVNRKILIKIINKKINKWKNKDIEMYHKWYLIKIWIEIINQSGTAFNNKIIGNTQGVPMGSKFSPMIFNFYLSYMIKEFRKEKCNKNLFISLYADDSYFKNDWYKMDDTINKFIQICDKYGFKINFNKCEILINDNIDIKIIEMILYLAKKYKLSIKYNIRYLGTWIKLNDENDIISTEDEYKEMGNLNIFKKLTWDNLKKIVDLYIIGKIRYNFTCENDIEIRKKILAKWMLKVVNIKPIQRYNYIQFCNDINLFKIILFNEYNINKSQEEETKLDKKKIIDYCLKYMNKLCYNGKDKWLIKLTNDFNNDYLKVKEYKISDKMDINIYYKKINKAIIKEIAKYNDNDTRMLYFDKNINSEIKHLITNIDLNKIKQNKFIKYILDILNILIVNNLINITNIIIKKEQIPMVELKIIEIIKILNFYNEYIMWNPNKIYKKQFMDMIDTDVINDKEDISKMFKNLIDREIDEYKNNYINLTTINKIEAIKVSIDEKKRTFMEIIINDYKKRNRIIEEAKDRIRNTQQELVNIEDNKSIEKYLNDRKKFILKKIIWFKKIRKNFNQLQNIHENTINLLNGDEILNKNLIAKWNKVINLITLEYRDKFTWSKEILLEMDEYTQEELIQTFKKKWIELDKLENKININKSHHQWNDRFKMKKNNNEYRMKVINRNINLCNKNKKILQRLKMENILN